MNICHLNIYTHKKYLVLILFIFSLTSEALQAEKPLRRPPWRQNVTHQNLLQALDPTQQHLQRLKLKDLPNNRARFLITLPHLRHFRPNSIPKQFLTRQFDPYVRNTSQSDCIKTLSNTPEIPHALRKVGASNIEINEREHISKNTNQSRFLHYDLSFPVNGQTKHIYLRLGKPIIYDVFYTAQVLERLRDIFGYLPERALVLVDSIFIEYKIRAKRPLLGTTEVNRLHKNNISIYYQYPSNRGSSDQIQGLSHAEETMLHELAHVIEVHQNRYTSKYGIPESNPKWLEAIAKDSTSVSKYGDDATGEDFAEAMQLYMMTNGGLYYPEVVRKYAHRFAISDEIMGVDPLERKKISEINQLFEVQSNDLLRKFGLPISAFLRDTPEHVGDLWKLKQDISLEEKMTETLMHFWRHNPNGLRISKILADKIHTLQKERSLHPNSIENRLTKKVLECIWIDNYIPEFIIETIYLINTLSTSEMEYRLYILEQAGKIFHEKYYISFEQALEEIMNI